MNPPQGWQCPVCRRVYALQQWATKERDAALAMKERYPLDPVEDPRRRAYHARAMAFAETLDILNGAPGLASRGSQGQSAQRPAADDAPKRGEAARSDHPDVIRTEHHPDVTKAVNLVRRRQASQSDAMRALREQVETEVARATRKFPTWPTDPIHAANVVLEEAGELAKAVLEHTYEPDKSSRDDVRKEAIETAAMAIRFLLSMDRYRFAPCEQHNQAEEPRRENA